MFRELRRKDRKISDEEMLSLLANERRGVLAVNGDDGYPYAIPVNFYYDPEAGKIYFHGSKAGHKVDALRRDDRICFTVYGNETASDLAWAPYMSSVIIFGRCKLVDDADETLTHVRKLAEKYYISEADIDAEIKKDIRAAQLYEITIEHICGKRIREK